MTWRSLLCRLCCARHGHATLLQFERDRMFMRCVDCGYESPGWDLSEKPPAAVRANVVRFRKRLAMLPTRSLRLVR